MLHERRCVTCVHMSAAGPTVATVVGISKAKVYEACRAN